MNQGRVEQIAEPYAAYEQPNSEFVGGFLGKANIFQLSIDRSAIEPSVRIAEALIALEGIPLTTASVIVRPEKILFSEPQPSALPGIMKTRVFQGNHWLCQVKTSAGDVLVIRQNDGVSVPAEGATVHLRWRAQDMRPVGAAN